MGLIDWLQKQTYEGKIRRSFGSVESIKRGAFKTRLKIAVLEPKKGTERLSVRIGFETVAPFAYESFGTTLTPENAKKLSELLIQACDAIDSE